MSRHLHVATDSDRPDPFAGLTPAQIEAGTRRPDVVVLDLGLPDGDGVALIRELRTWSAVPVVVLSARSAENDKIAALDAGADDYLVKPFSRALLSSAINRAFPKWVR